MTKHTPGPWDVYPNPNGDLSVVSRGFIIATVEGWEPDKAAVNELDGNANALLITKAPEMYQLLEGLITEKIAIEDVMTLAELLIAEIKDKQ